MEEVLEEAVVGKPAHLLHHREPITPAQIRLREVS